MRIFRITKLIFVLFFASNVFGQTTISSVQELAAAAANSGQNIVMTPGTYQMEDYLTSTVINSITADNLGRRAMIDFSGSNNTFDFTGVTIEVNTDLLQKVGRNVVEFYLTGNNINFKGLTVTDIGNSPTANGGQSFTIVGDDVTVENVTLNVSGSYPYGYGDLLGKGANRLTSAMQKHSGMLINGLNTKVIGCTINSKAFGHLFFVQGGRNVLFQDCVAIAQTRTTDDMLAETSGEAYELGFPSVYPNYNRENVITPGYTKSLSEVGFRTYGSGAGNDTEGVTLINCTARNARVGFALEVGGPILVQNCEATGCESGYNLQDDVVVENSRGDAVNGPLLYLNGSNSNVELALMSDLPTTTVHALATIAGANNKVAITKWQDQTRLQNHSILVGATRPTGTNPFSPLGTAAMSGLVLNNCSGMPVEIYNNTSSSYVYSEGSITDNGTGNTIDNTTCEGDGPELISGEGGLIDEVYNIAANSSNPDPFYGWDPDWGSTYGYMEIDEENDQLVCTFDNNGDDYIRFYGRKTDPSLHQLNANNYPILAIKGARPSNYVNYTLNLVNASGETVQIKDGASQNGVETLAKSQILSGTSDVYYWDLSEFMSLTETWNLSGFNCVDTKQVDPISVMRLDYIKTFESVDALMDYESQFVGLINETYNRAAGTSDPDPFYGWNPDWGGTYGSMTIDEDTDQLVCTFDDNGAGYVRFYWRKENTEAHKLNPANYPILVMKGKRPDNYTNFTLNLVNESGQTIQFKDGKSVNGVETLSRAKLLSGTSDVYYWDLSDNIITDGETWELSGFNCVNTLEVDPISVMKLDYIKTFTDLDALKVSEGLLSTDDVILDNQLKVYPNPVVNKLTVLLENIDTPNTTISLYSLEGKKVLEKKDINAAKVILNLSNLKKGLYVLRVNCKNNNIIRKIVKM